MEKTQENVHNSSRDEGDDDTSNSDSYTPNIMTANHIQRAKGDAEDTEKTPENNHKYSCESCDYITYVKKDYVRHLFTAKHKNRAKGDVQDTVKPPKKPLEYTCNCCHFSSIVKKDYDRHLETEKHKNRANGNTATNESNQCGCGKIYARPGGLWRHKKKCSQKSVPDTREGITYTIQEDTPQNTIQPTIQATPQDTSQNTIQLTPQNTQPVINADMFMELMKQNNEFKALIIEQSNKFMEFITTLPAVSNTTNNNNTISNNTQFNLNVFLNEHCKDAINMDDFIKSLEVTVDDLVRTGKLGYVEGISQIFINGLKQLDISKRPIHCTDLKRESVYLRYENKWEKETDDKPRLNLAIQRVTGKNLRQLRTWEIENPDYTIIDTKASDDYFEITKNCMGGTGDEDKKLKDKVIKNIIKAVKIP